MCTRKTGGEGEARSTFAALQVHVLAPALVLRNPIRELVQLENTVDLNGQRQIAIQRGVVFQYALDWRRTGKK
jgi:hypothetical protein